jgi:hypothetical protein
MSDHPMQANLVLGVRPRLELRLPPDSPRAFATWLVVELPGPQPEERHEGRYLPDPRLPESEIELTWGDAGRTLAVTACGRTWHLEQDADAADRWRLRQTD